MASALLNMLSELAANPQKLEVFNNQPKAVMDEYGLTEEQKTLLLSRNEKDDIKAIMHESTNQFAAEQRRCA